MILSVPSSLNSFFGIPRESGDDPFPRVEIEVDDKYSPRERG